MTKEVFIKGSFVKLSKILSVFILIVIFFAFIFLLLRNFINYPPNAQYATSIGLIYLATLIVYGWTFGAIALKWAKKENIKLPILTRPNRYFFYGIAFTLILLLITIFMSKILKDAQLSYFISSHMSSFLIFKSMTVNTIFILSFIVILNIINSLITTFCVMLGGELMWRGYLLNKLKDQGFWKASLITGTVFGIWSLAPTLFNSSSAILIKIIYVFIMCVLISPLLVYLRIKGNSVLLPAITYSLFFSFGSMGDLLFSKNHVNMFSIYGLFGIISLVLVNFYLYKNIKTNIL
jgi:uncharacterized protein